MNFIGMLPVIIATISATLCSAEEPWRTRCFGDFELKFFKHNDNTTLQKSYHEAKVFCESLGGYLAKVDTQEITDVINETIEINYKQSYFIGGNDIRKEKDWKWQDGTDVIMRDEEGYQNWKSNQPNNARGDEDCMLVGRETYRWIDSSCHEKLNYICQTGLLQAFFYFYVTTQRITKGDFSSSTKKVCRVSKCSDATVKWYKDSSSEPITEELTEKGIYQTINKKSSTLYLKKASISDAGIYHCNSTKSNITVASLFKVDGNPTIISVNNSACSRSLVVRWKPSKFATGFSHKIVAVNSDTKFETAYGSSKLKSTKTLTTELPGLESGTEYVVTVQVEDYEYSVNATARTIGNTESTFSARLSKNCSIQWAWKHNVLPKTATRWEITGFCKRVATRESTNSSNLEIASEGESVSTPHIFIPEPNRNCTVSIKVLGCAEDSEAVNATGFCVGKPAAPTSIAKPVVVEEDIDTKGILRITVTKPHEGNGLISCLFVIVNDGSSHANNEFNWKSLAEANGSTNEYIAVALPVSRIPDDEIIVDLGNNSKSACDVTQTKNHMAGQFQPNKTFVGQNWKLNKENFYSVWVVSTTPCGDNICFGTSEKLEFEYENVPPVIVFVAAIVGPILVIAGIIFGIWRFRSKRNPRKREFLPEVNASISDNVELDNISSPPLAAKPEVSVEINDESSGHDNLSASRLSDEQSDTSIRISNFEDVYNLMGKQENAPFNEQFQKIISQSAKLGKPHKIASNSELTKKNRYRNILPFDDTIVKVPAAKIGIHKRLFCRWTQQATQIHRNSGTSTKYC
uniref:uncharacterized protein LOC120335105 n=1 Tax=Styela clava TaxID=7725 RepID=UPI00193A34FD|nr:uncharacterized protein LOC120335105 [Styela clava]